MGYETRLYTGQEYPMVEGFDKVPTVGVIAMVDLSKAGCNTNTGKFLAEARKSDEHFAFYAEDGDTLITEDRYGEKLTAVDIAGLVEAMEKDQAEDYDYRRYALAIPVLRCFLEHPGWVNDKFTRIRCIQFGY